MKLVHTAYEPAGAGPHPAIVAFHGWGASAMDLLSLATFIADGRFLMVCPQGPLEVPTGAIRGWGWFPITRGTAPDLQKVDAAVNEASIFIDQALERYPIDRRKLVVLGFSQGGMMAYGLAIRQPEKYAALVGLSAWCPPELVERAHDRERVAQLQTMVQHGRADDIIEIARARDSLDTLRRMGVQPVYHEYDTGHEISAEGIEDLSDFLSRKVLSPIITT